MGELSITPNANLGGIGVWGSQKMVLLIACEKEKGKSTWTRSHFTPSTNQKSNTPEKVEVGSLDFLGIAYGTAVKGEGAHISHKN